MAQAFDALAATGFGVQLTPGNHPTPGFEAHVARSGVAVRTHHGFGFGVRARAVWRDDGALLTHNDSVHPPEATKADVFWARLEREGCPVALEAMYPGQCLGTGEELERAMGLGLVLAIDVSHLFIQRTAGVLTDVVLKRVLDWPKVAEVHVSANDGRHDSHRRLRDDSYGLAWASERERSGTPLVYEAYLHGLPPERWVEQLERLS